MSNGESLIYLLVSLCFTT